MVKRLKVLSIDGGGVYGVVSAMVLAEIEKMTEKPIAELFDLIAGTSTGGIIALGLTIPDAAGRKPRYSAADMAELYTTKGKQIFSRSIWHKVTALGNLLDEKYEANGIEKMLKKYFGDVMLSETLVDVLIPSYNIEQRDAYFFKTHKAREEEDRNFYVRDVARATSAAPSYFEPTKTANITKTQEFALIDGGVFANNPAMCAYAEIKKLYPDVDDICFVSVGTSGAQRPYRYEDAKGWGAAAWIVPLFEIMMSGVQETVDYQLQQIFPTDPKKKGTYTRIQPLTAGDIQFDQVDESSIRLLKEFAAKYIDSNQELLESLACQLLVE